MSSASLCGPTNALTSLQKHTTADRTLQQDRLRAQAGPSLPQSFRTSHTSNVNHEFQQFSSGGSEFRQAAPPQLGGVPNWAAEFQQLRISHSPLQHTTPRHAWGTPAPTVAAPSGASWHAEFLSQMAQPTAYTPLPHQQLLHHQQHHQQQQQQFVQQSQFSGLPIQTHSPSAYDSPGYLHDTQDTVCPHQQFYDLGLSSQSAISSEQQSATDAAFVLAFDEAQRWQLEESQHDILDAISQPVVEEEAPGIEKGKEKEHRAEDPDELSRTAGQLLESLASEQSQKFKESNFLKLMRQLRDKEVEVEGAELVWVGGRS